MKMNIISDASFGLPCEIRLWNACIKQHFLDLFVKSNNKKNRKLLRDAKEFLLCKNSSLEFICDLTNHNYEVLLKNLNKLYIAISTQQIPVDKGLVLLDRLLIYMYIQNSSDTNYI